MNEIPKYDLTIKQGEEYSVDFIYAQDDETPVDVTGWTIESHLRQYPHSADYFPFTCSADSTGFHMAMDDAITDQITFTKGVYDVFITDPEISKRTPLIYGQATIIPRTTR